MRVLFLTPLFQPEPNHLKGEAFIRELRRRGHDVRVLTGFPNYPHGRLYPGYRMRPFMRESISGIPVMRSVHSIHRGRSGFLRLVSYVSHALSSGLAVLANGFRPDVVHVYQGPATLAFPAMVLRFFRRVPYILDVQDLWPESVTESGMLSHSAAGTLLGLWSRWTYRLAGSVIVLSEGYKKVLVERGANPDRVFVIRNWADETAGATSAAGVPSGGPPVKEERFTVVYAGNIGKLQALRSVLDAAEILLRKKSGIRFLFVGDGVELPELRREAGDKGLENVAFLPRRSVVEMELVFRNAGALLVHLKRSALAEVAIPQKIQAYLFAGKPIIAAIPGEGAALVLEAGAGVACPPGSGEAIAAAAESLSRLSPEERRAMGRRGRDFYDRELSFRVGAEKVVEAYRAAAASSRRGAGVRS